MSEPVKQEKEQRAPRRIVILEGGREGTVAEVLREYTPAEASGTRLHTDLVSLGKQHPGRLVAAEWLGPLGWTRFLWYSGGEGN